MFHCADLAAGQVDSPYHWYCARHHAQKMAELAAVVPPFLDVFCWVSTSWKDLESAAWRGRLCTHL